jgi:hypothetical protein
MSVRSSNKSTPTDPKGKFLADLVDSKQRGRRAKEFLLLFILFRKEIINTLSDEMFEEVEVEIPV